jgi:hypothetical protein
MFFGSGEKNYTTFPTRVFEPLLRNAQKRDKTNRAKQPREKKKTKRRKKATFFVMSPDTFLQHNFIVFL